MQIIFIHGIGLMDSDRDRTGMDPFAGWREWVARWRDGAAPPFFVEEDRQLVLNVHHRNRPVLPAALAEANSLWHLLEEDGEWPANATTFFAYYGEGARSRRVGGDQSYRSSVEHYAALLGEVVQRAAASGEDVAIVAHSLGGFVTRVALHKGHLGERGMARFVPVGSPQRGIGATRDVAAEIVSRIPYVDCPEAAELSEHDLKRHMGKAHDPEWPGHQFLEMCPTTKVAAICHTRFDALVRPNRAFVKGAPRSYLNTSSSSPQVAIHCDILELAGHAIEEALLANHLLTVEGTLHVKRHVALEGKAMAVTLGHSLTCRRGGNRIPLSQLVYESDQLVEWDTTAGYVRDIDFPFRLQVPMRPGTAAESGLLVGAKWQRPFSGPGAAVWGLPPADNSAMWLRIEMPRSDAPAAEARREVRADDKLVAFEGTADLLPWSNASIV